MVRRTLLIVDDHAGFAPSPERYSKLKDSTSSARLADGKSALVASRVLNPDVVLLDVALSDLDGFMVCDRLARDATGPAM